MKEPLSNIGGICDKHANLRLSEFQKTIGERTITKGSYIKAAFIDGSATEYMWIRVISINQDTIEGILDNDPIVVRNILYGDTVKINISKIADLINP